MDITKTTGGSSSGLPHLLFSARGGGDEGTLGDLLERVGLVMCKSEFCRVEDAYFRQLITQDRLAPFLSLHLTDYFPTKIL